MMNGKIYKYFNKKKYEETDIKSYYIGQTIQTIEERAGCNGKNYTRNSNTKFSNAIKKWGWDAFEYEILEEGIETQEELNEAEIKYIAEYDSYNNGYNSTLGGDGTSGIKPSNNVKKMVYCPELDMSFNTIKDAAEYVGITDKSIYHISKVCKGKRKTAGKVIIDGKEIKLTWKYIDIIDNDNTVNTNFEKSVCTKIYCPELNMVFTTVKDAAEYIKMKAPSHISDVCKGKQKYAGTATINNKNVNLTWKYVDDNFEISEKCDNTVVELSEPILTRHVFCPELNMEFDSIKKAGKYVGLTEKGSSHITEVCKGKRKYAGKYNINGKETCLTWKYIDNQCNVTKNIDSSLRKRVYCPELNIEFDSIRDATKYVGLKSDANISHVCKGQKEHAGSYIINGVKTKLTWKYIDLD